VLQNKNFYPTPKETIKLMWDMVDDNKNIQNILEPHGGKGDIIEYINSTCHRNYNYYKKNISTIEKDPDLRALLQGKKFNVIHSDFLQFTGEEQFDLIIANPPFDDGVTHLQHAIDVMYNGQIVFLLNAENLKNPHTNQRKQLLTKLESLNATIEYHSDLFKTAERKTNVEIALIHINIKNSIESDLFGKEWESVKDVELDLDPDNELTKSNQLEALVDAYNDEKQVNLEFIQSYFKNRNKLIFSISVIDSQSQDIEEEVQSSVKELLRRLRERYWRKVLQLDDISKKLTEVERKKFNVSIKSQETMEFTIENVQNYILYIMKNYNDILGDAVQETFEYMTERYAYNEEYGKNIHYFNGWKTNKAFFVNKKIILPRIMSYGDAFRDLMDKKWTIDRYYNNFLDDIDKVMSYFDGRGEYKSILDALEDAFNEFPQKTKNITSTYFKISIYKKGTIHLTFLDENIRRRFNIFACQRKNMLPHDYSKKPFDELSKEQQSVVEEFEGKTNYNKRLNQIGFISKALPQIAFVGDSK